MKKITKKCIAKYFLGIFVLNIIITPQTNPIAIPAVIAAPAAEVLVHAGFAIYAIVASYLTSKNSPLPNATPQQSKEAGQEFIYDTGTASHVIPSIATNIIKEIAKQSEPTELLPIHPKLNHIESAKTSIDSLAKFASNNIAKKTLDELLEKPCKCTTTTSITPISVEATYKTIPLPHGIQLQTADDRFYTSIQFDNKGIVDAQRIGTQLACKNLQIMRHEICNNPSARNMIVTDVRNTINCLAQTQTGNLVDRIVACLMMDKLYIQAPVFNELAQTVEDLKKIYFHQDGSICFKVFYCNTKAPSLITNYIDKIHQQLGPTIGRNELINPSLYQELKSLSFRSTTRHIGIFCSGKKDYSSSGQQFNQAVLLLIESCIKFDFEKAQAIQQQYPKCWDLQNIIDLYKAEHQMALNKASSTIYDCHGIVKVAHSDPAYASNQANLIKSSTAEKEIINQNLLVRHHLKEKMHEHWNIPQSAPQEIHEALYQIIGEDCSALSDISSLQAKIEDIIKTAPNQEYDTLVQTFYEPNGVLKEYALHIPETKTIALPAKILTKRYETERQKLNTLLCSQIKYPLQVAQVKQTIQNLSSWLNACDTKSQRDAKTEFNKAYEVVMKQEPIVKIPPQSQNQEIIDVNSSSPIPPEFEPENDNIEITKTSSPELIYDNTATENDLHHIFGRAKHNLDKFLEIYDGNKVKAYKDIYDEIFKHVKNKGIRGLYNREIIELRGIKLYVNGIVLPDGTVKIGTAFIP